MEAKEIEDKAIDYAGQFEERYQLALFKAFIQGAEWMQEQAHKEFLEANAEIEKQHVQDIRQKQAEVDELSNKVSELTEALDASHIFCEGVYDLMTERSWDWFCENFDKFTKIKSVAEGVKLAVEFKKAMKGDED